MDSFSLRGVPLGVEMANYAIRNGTPAGCEMRLLTSRGRFARLSYLFFTIVLLLWLSAPAAAQISPGSLSRAHQPLNGTTNCTTCHKLGGGQATFKCVDCHSEIASRIASRKAS